MKPTTFYIVATLSSLLVISCSFVKREPSNKLNSCLKRVIENFYGNDDVLYFAHVDNFYDDIPFDVPNPKVILNFDHPGVLDFEKRVAKNFVAAWDYDRRPHIFDLISWNFRWNHEITSKKHVVFIRTTDQLNTVYHLLLSWALVYTVVVYYNEKYDDDPIIISANPNGPECNCKQWPLRFYPNEPCDAGMNLNRSIPQRLRNYNQCPIGYLGTIFNTRTDRVSSCVSETLDSVGNVINARILPNETENGNFKEHISLNYRTQATYGEYLSGVILQSKLLWLVPHPEQVVGLRVFSKVFKWTTWLLIVCAFIATVSTWAIILFRKSKCEDLVKIIFDVLSLTIYGLMKPMPKVSLLRFVILIYILSFINIQTAFICKLIPVLTVPIYERSIQTLEELLEAGYQIYTAKEIKDVYFKRTESSDTLYSNIKGNLQAFCEKDYDGCLRMLMLYNNISVLVPAYTLENWQTNNGFTFHHVIVNDKVVENIQLTFVSRYNQYIMDSANIVIKRLIEGGFYLKRERDIDEYHRKSAQLREPSNDPVALNLSHVYGIFIIYGFGISIAVLVFILELLVGKFSKFNSPTPHHTFLS
ncbi:uncharacterized protein LOC116174192 [Photinus pyralis]|uniref:uncharacterized protein LOC116174192 n=1 Tax=Photinus pyralis TaxID=7054 RepID=UPI0012671E93|nr:uncharacterized protein LOC116174192 [Photinus pyralis]